MVLLCLLGAAGVAAAELVRGRSAWYEDRAAAASARMREAMGALGAHRAENGPAVDRAVDINGTGLIGVAFSSMTTTVGSLEAKRTTANPDMAALMVHLLDRAGVREGDFVAVGASGSFPGLILATLCAADAMGLDAGLVVSLGASQWGANAPGFTWLDIEDVLYSSGMLSYRSAAASIGGDVDVGRDLSAEARAALTARIEASPAMLIDDPNLASNVAARMEIYLELASDRRIAAFVNIGGAWANLGTDASVLELSPGVIRSTPALAPEKRGVIHAMADSDVPIIHLLNVKELAQRFGVPWDPSPLPAPGPLRVPETGLARIGVTALACIYLAAVAVWLVRDYGRRRRTHRAFPGASPDEPG